MLLEELLLKYKKNRKNIVIYFSVLSTDSRKNLFYLVQTVKLRFIEFLR